MFKKILIANRGEIAYRIIRTCRRMGIKTVAIYSDIDANLPFVEYADEAYPIGPSPSRESYLCGDKIIDIALASGAEAIHPGYGFLSENAAFAKAVEKAGLTFIGPSPKIIDLMGDKIEAKKLAQKAGVNLVPGTSSPLTSQKEALDFAKTVGYPIILKAAAGGGGKGMRIAQNENDIQSAYERAQSESLSSFGDDRLFAEKYIENPRHIEIQILADHHRHVLHLGERDCSLQRRHQKIIEEAPSPFLESLTATTHSSLREQMIDQALNLAKTSKYTSAGTVEFIVSPDGEFYFLEMNTRLQVEHPVTEAIYGIDLVEWMIRIAHNEPLTICQEELIPRGHAIEARLYAEDPNQNFLPSAGRLIQYYHPPVPETEYKNTDVGRFLNPSQEIFHAGRQDLDLLSFFGDLTFFPSANPASSSFHQSSSIRLDNGYNEGDQVGIFYDPMISKLISWGGTRQECLDQLIHFTSSLLIEGPKTNQDFLIRLLSHPDVQHGQYHTHFIQNELDKLVTLKDVDDFQDEETYLGIHDVPNSLKSLFILSSSYIEFILENHGSKDFLCLSNPQQDNQRTHGVRFQHDKYAHPQFITDGTWGDPTWKQQFQSIHFRWIYQHQIFEITLDGVSTIGRHQKHPFSGHLITLKGYSVLLNVIRPEVWKLLENMPAKKSFKQIQALKAPMPGIVIQLPITTGQQVIKGQDLALIEAMKMENILKSPIKGTISEICVKVGDSLTQGQIIAKFNPD